MAYLGAQPNKTLTKTTSQSFNGTGSATTFTLNRAVNTEEELEVFVENVQQEPGSGKSYTASGTTLTFDEAPPSGTGNIYVIYRGQAEVTTRLEHDANQALSATTGTFSGAVSGTDGTFTGDLTVDTDTLVVDAANNRVGVGLTTPERVLHVNAGTNNNCALFESTDANADIYLQDSGATGNTSVGLRGQSNDLVFITNGSEAARIDSSGNVGIGTTSPDTTLDVFKNSGGDQTALIVGAHNYGDTGKTYIQLGTEYGDGSSRIGSFNNSGNLSTMVFETHASGSGSWSEAMRIKSTGQVLIGNTSGNIANAGFVCAPNDFMAYTNTSTDAGDRCLLLNRQGGDGFLIEFRQANSNEGNISVSGTTVSYNGGHLSRWSRLADSSKDTSIVKGTVLTNLDQMVVWSYDDVLWTADDELPDGVSVGDVKTAAYTEDNEQLNCMAVSSVEGDANVAGVFVNWDNDNDGFNDMNVAMTGDMVIRIASGTTVARGDLLMSAGDGTAKPQGDDIVRSKTIAKVTSTTVSHTYDDGSYLVPCVLMAC